MELIVEVVGAEIVEYLIDTLGHDKERAIFQLRQEIAHRTTYGASHSDRPTSLLNDCELTVNLSDGLEVAVRYPLSRLVVGAIEENVGVRIDEVDYSVDGARSVRHR
jgi:hypothetical protein